MARNHAVSGRWAPWKMVPAVTLVCVWQALHWKSLFVSRIPEGDTERTTRNYAAMVAIACMVIWLRL